MSNSLTVTEKQHWKERIEKRIGRRIDALCAEEAGFMERIESAARERALESLGVGKLQKQMDRIDQQRDKLQVRKDNVEASIAEKVLGLSVRKARHGFSTRDVSAAIEKQQAIHRDGVLAETPRGCEILELEVEQEHLLDTVWLATSSKQIKELWTKVDDKLGGQQTKLQREALAIEPIEDHG